LDANLSVIFPPNVGASFQKNIRLEGPMFRRGAENPQVSPKTNNETQQVH